MKTTFYSLNTPTRIAIFGSLVFAVLNLIFLGATYQRRTAAESLQKNIRAMEDNLIILKQIDEDRLDSLRTELEQAQKRVTELENSFPDLGAPFAIYPQGKNLATQSQMELIGISLLNIDRKESPSGPVQVKEYFLELKGNMANCLMFLDRLEEAGQQTLSIENISISAQEETCELEVQAVGFQK
jgi:hypothetical protein